MRKGTRKELLGASGALALLDHPEQRERFAQDAGPAEPAIDELLRYTSPVEMTPPRVTREEVTLASVTIPRGEFVSAVLGSANRDQSRFKDPDTLDIARDPNRHLAFGQGAHFCLGANLARMEGQIALTTLFRRFPAFAWPSPRNPCAGARCCRCAASRSCRSRSRVARRRSSHRRRPAGRTSCAARPAAASSRG